MGRRMRARARVCVAGGSGLPMARCPALPFLLELSPAPCLLGSVRAPALTLSERGRSPSVCRGLWSSLRPCRVGLCGVVCPRRSMRWCCALPGPGLSRARRGTDVPGERDRSPRSARGPLAYSPCLAWLVLGVGQGCGPGSLTEWPSLTWPVLGFCLCGLGPSPRRGGALSLLWRANAPRPAPRGAPGALQVVPQVPEAERRCCSRSWRPFGPPLQVLFPCVCLGRRPGGSRVVRGTPPCAWRGGLPACAPVAGPGAGFWPTAGGSPVLPELLPEKGGWGLALLPSSDVPGVRRSCSVWAFP